MARAANHPADVLIVGASAAGLSTVDALRRQGYEGPITLLGAELHPPYDRPPLSKQVLAGTWLPERAHLRAVENATVVLGDAAVGLDPATRTVRTASGRELRAEAIVIATGAHARTMPGATDLGGVHTLRTLDDSLALREGLLAAGKVVVVGDGVLGTEIAATARTLGLDVTLAGPQTAPMRLQLGPVVAARLAALHEKNGVRLRLGVPVTELQAPEGRIHAVRLADGSELPADLAVVAFGAAPATGWLHGSGLAVDDGLVCDSRCRAADGIYAVGDVARFHHERFGRHVRLENRTNAVEQAAAVAANILGADRPYLPVPYFWTDQFDAKLHIYGLPGIDADVEVVDGDIDAGRFVVLYHRDDRPLAVLGWNMPKQARLQRQKLLPTIKEVA
jgi:NADPH-dependent 2,4-dienoyl-CoA reductase/sulfur reductase-like enzyme